MQQIQDQVVKDWISQPTCQFWIGPAAHVVAYSVRNGTMSNIVLLVPDNLPADVARQPGSIDEMRAIFTQWDPMLNRFLDKTQLETLFDIKQEEKLEKVTEPEYLEDPQLASAMREGTKVVHRAAETSVFTK